LQGKLGYQLKAIIFFYVYFYRLLRGIDDPAFNYNVRSTFGKLIIILTYTIDTTRPLSQIKKINMNQ